MAVFDLVLSSGGTKGVAFAGALEVLEDKKHAAGRLVGSSAGAITAVLVAAGYTGRELVAAATTEAGKKSAFAGFLAPAKGDELLAAIRREDSETRAVLKKAVERAMDKGVEWVRAKKPATAAALKAVLGLAKADLYDAVFDAIFDPTNDKQSALAPVFSFLEFGGLFSSDAFVNWLEARLKAKHARCDAATTLGEFHRLTGRDLSVLAADTSDREALVLNHRTAPDVPVVQAVRMSMSVPIVWQEVTWKPQWGKYLGRDKVGHALVDGAAMLSFPIRYVADPKDPQVRAVMGEPPAGGSEPLGLMLDEQLKVPGNVPPPPPPSRVIERSGRLIDTVLRWEDEAVKPYLGVTCRIPCAGFSAMEFVANSERVEILINSGRCAMTEHLKQRR